jgi:hypothetical protein
MDSSIIIHPIITLRRNGPIKKRKRRQREGRGIIIIEGRVIPSALSSMKHAKSIMKYAYNAIQPQYGE